jgi:hypothetical protein
MKTESSFTLGDLPLHYSCSFRAHLGSRPIFGAKIPESLKVAGFRENLSLHYACTHKAALDVVRYLVQEYLQATNSSGKKPIDLAKSPWQGDPPLYEQSSGFVGIRRAWWNYLRAPAIAAAIGTTCLLSLLPR